MPLLLDTSCTKSGISFKNVQLKMRFCFLILMSSLTFSLRTLFLKLALTPLGFFSINGNSSLSVLMVGQYSWEKLHLMPFEVLSCPVIFEDVLWGYVFYSNIDNNVYYYVPRLYHLYFDSNLSVALPNDYTSSSLVVARLFFLPWTTLTCFCLKLDSGTWVSPLAPGTAVYIWLHL